MVDVSCWNFLMNLLMNVACAFCVCKFSTRPTGDFISLALLSKNCAFFLKSFLIHSNQIKTTSSQFPNNLFLSEIRLLGFFFFSSDFFFFLWLPTSSFASRGHLNTNSDGLWCLNQSRIDAHVFVSDLVCFGFPLHTHSNHWKAKFKKGNIW